MSQLPRIAWAATRIFGKAMREAGRQAVANARHKPEGLADSGKAAAGGDSSQNISSTMKMSVEEAQLILNVKKGDSMEKILENYERIFKANAKPEPPAAVDPKVKPTGKKVKAPAVVYSHYLQSKVYRALERIKAEHGGELVAEGTAGEAAGETLVAGAAAEGSVAPETMAKAAAEGQPFTGAGPGQGPVPGEGAAQAAEGQAGASSSTFESANKTAQSTAEEPTEEPKREPIYNPAVGRAKPKGEKVADSNETIQL